MKCIIICLRGLILEKNNYQNQESKKKKFRGIKTTSERLYEAKPKTIINRLGQKSISLPRITDDKRWAGFPGLAGTAKKIAKMIPNCYYYVEPFAGTAKVYQELSISMFQYAILNDRSKFIVEWLQKEFGRFAEVTDWDYSNCMHHWDSKETFFLIDQPWNKSYYNQKFSSFTKNSVREYDEEIIEQCKDLKGKFIITSRRENKIMLNSGFKNILVESIYVVSGKYPKVLVTTNIDDLEEN